MQEMQETPPILVKVDGFSLAKESSAKEKSIEKPIKVNTCTNIPQNNNKQEIIFQAITPMLVMNKTNNKALKTYAFYDNGSIGGFLTENLQHHLEAPSTKTTLIRNGQSLVKSIIIKDLIVLIYQVHISLHQR